MKPSIKRVFKGFWMRMAVYTPIFFIINFMFNGYIDWKEMPVFFGLGGVMAGIFAVCDKKVAHEQPQKKIEDFTEGGDR